MDNGLFPGEQVKRFAVDVPRVRVKDAKTDDGQRAERDFDMLHSITYKGQLRRLDGQMTLLLEWVDFDGEGHRLSLPHQVVQRIVDVRERMMDQAKSDRSRRIMQKRIAQGYVPSFAHRKETEE